MTFSYFVKFAWMFLGPLAAVIIPVLVGQRLGNYQIKKQLIIPQESIGSAVSAAFGLLAFMMAITFQIAANRYEDRKALLIEEVKQIRTSYLRASLVPEPYRSTTQRLLIEYVAIRVELNKDTTKIQQAIHRSHQILDTLWSYAEALAVIDRSSEVYALYTTAINDLVEAYNERLVMVFTYRIPLAIMWGLFIIGFLSMFLLGYQFGVSGKGSFMINMLLAVTFAVVMSLIFALDRPEEGFVTLDQKPLMTLTQQLTGTK
jgi:hypothetical protein